MKLFKKIKRAIKNFMRTTAREAVAEFDVLRAKLHGVADAAREEAAHLREEIAAMQARYMSELDEAQRASRVADRINELLK